MALCTPYLAQKHFEKRQENPYASLQTIFYISGLPKGWHFWKRRAPENPEESFNGIFKILDMRSICIEKHEWHFANMVPIPITKIFKNILEISKLRQF